MKKILYNPIIKSRDLLLIEVAYYGGLRIDEALKSKKEDYRGDPYCYLLLRKQKTDKKNWEAQPIPDYIYSDVMRYCRDNNITDEEFVFQSNRHNRLSYAMAYKMVKTTCIKLGITKKIATHSFRRSRATHLKDNGMSLDDVKLFLRHRKIDTTILYLKISKKQLSDEINRVDKKLLLRKI